MFTFCFALLITEIYSRCMYCQNIGETQFWGSRRETVSPILCESPDEIKGFVVAMEALLCLYAPWRKRWSFWCLPQTPGRSSGRPHLIPDSDRCPESLSSSPASPSVYLALPLQCGNPWRRDGEEGRTEMKGGKWREGNGGRKMEGGKWREKMEGGKGRVEERKREKEGYK